MEAHLFHTFFLIFGSAALLASFALYTRQPLLVAYILVGIGLGPYGLSLITDLTLVTEMSHIGIVFLLFLLGLDMQPAALKSVFQKASIVALCSSSLFAITGFALGYLFGFTLWESVVIGIAMMFSSTIIGIKLLPTTVLHHRHMGEMMVGLLLLQDFIAIFCLLLLLNGSQGAIEYQRLTMAVLALPLLAAGAVIFVKTVLLKIIARFDRFHEYIFLLAIGWCLSLAALAEAAGLSAEIGAFIAGITIATSPIAQYIALNLKPLRDFFLVLFFFSLGAQLNIFLLPEVIVPAVILAAIALSLKPLVFQLLLRKHSERKVLAWDMGFRLGQISEFSLLITFVAIESQLIGNEASVMIQAATIITFVVSSYIVIFNFPNPIAISDKLRRD